MKKHGKRLATAAASIMLISLATGCGAEGEGGKVSELVIPAAETPWLDSYKKIASEYEKESGVKITFKVFPMEGLLTQQANAAQTGSNAFDLYQINEQWTGQFYDNQWVQPLTDVDSDFTWDKNLIEFDGVGRWDTESRTTAPDGVPYSLPINGNIHLFMYRKDLYKQLGLKVPTTWDDVVENGEKARSAGAVDNGYVVRGKTPTYDFSALLFSYGGSWFADEKNGDWTPTIDSPEGRKALEEFKRLSEVGPKAPQTIAQAEATSLMQGGQVLNASLVAAVAPSLEDEGSSRIAGDVGYAVMPGRTPVSGTWTLGIPTGLPDNRAQAAYDFVTWLTGKETMQKWVGYGGVTTRTDVHSDRPEQQAIVESADDIKAGLRYPFTPAMLDVTDPAIGQYLAGTMTIDEALATMQKGIAKAAEEAGYAP